MEYTDAQILQHLSSSSEKNYTNALKSLYHTHYGSIQYLIKKNGGSEEDAKDIFQDGIVVLFNQVRQDKLVLSCSIKTYLYSICRNQWLSKLRKNKRIVEMNDRLEYIPVKERIYENIMQSEQSQTISDLLDKMGEECRSILKLFYFYRFGMLDIQDRLGLASEQVAKNKKMKCMKRLKNMVLTSHSLKAELR